MADHEYYGKEDAPAAARLPSLVQDMLSFCPLLD